MIAILFALLAGILTIAAPCILPVLPILLGANVGSQNKQRPLLTVTGFIVSFAAASLLLSVLVQNTGLNPNALRTVAITLLAIFGLFMIWPKGFELLAARLSSVINKAGNLSRQQGSGNWSALVLGLTLGLLWTPCAGPVLGAILTLIATQGTTAQAAVLVVAYAIGAGIPMLLIAYGSQFITTKVRALAAYSVRIQQVFGLLILLLALAMYFQYDTKIQAILVDKFPAINLESKIVGDKEIVNVNTDRKPMKIEVVDLKSYGQAPEFTGIANWLNSEPLTMQQLRGKVVLIDFWTYSCINCIRTLPYLTKWHEAYRDKGLVIVGVHTPEFEFEKNTENVKTALERFNIQYPVAQDNDYATWNAYNNRYWPAKYLVDQSGNVVYYHFGEGEYDATENAIRQLLGIGVENNNNYNGNNSKGTVKTPEIYFGNARLQNLTSSQKASSKPTPYTLPSTLSLNQFALEGQWKFDGEKATLTEAPGKIRLKFYAGKIFMVAKGLPNTLMEVTVDGKPVQTVKIESSRLYPLFESDEYKEHTIELYINTEGFEAFTFTFE